MTGAGLAKPASGGTQQVIKITSGTSWTVPANWNSSNNTIEVIGGGGRRGPAGAQGVIIVTYTP